MNLGGIPLSGYLAVSAILFVMGAFGVLIRKNALVIFMSVELMLNAANLAFLAFARSYEITTGMAVFSGQLFVLFVMSVAAAEVAVGLALIVAIFKSKHSIDVDQMSSLKG
jgi:NADH-quinone oxidoreductase subunit K